MNGQTGVGMNGWTEHADIGRTEFFPRMFNSNIVAIIILCNSDQTLG